VAIVVPIIPFLAAFNTLLVAIFIFFPFAMVVPLTVLATGATLLLIVQSLLLLPRVLRWKNQSYLYLLPCGRVACVI